MCRTLRWWHFQVCGSWPAFSMFRWETLNLIGALMKQALVTAENIWAQWTYCHAGETSWRWGRTSGSVMDSLAAASCVSLTGVVPGNCCCGGSSGPGSFPLRQFKTLWKLSSDLCHPQDIFIQRTANQLIFNLLMPIFCKAWKRPEKSPAPIIPYSEPLTLLFLSRFDAQIERQIIILMLDIGWELLIINFTVSGLKFNLKRMALVCNKMNSSSLWLLANNNATASN